MLKFNKSLIIGDTEWKGSLRFDDILRIGGSSTPSWQDIVLSGNGSLSLTAALANGLNYLKLFGGTEQRNLPSGYTQVEYLESSGTQYIDTGIVLNSKATITIVGQFMSDTSPNPITIWGFMGNSNMPRWGCSVYTNRWLMDLNSTTNSGDANTNKHTFVNETNGTTTYNSYVDGVSIYSNPVGIANPTSYISNVLSAYIFARNNSNTAGNFSSSRIYSFNIVQNDVEVINLIPCRRNSDNVLGMYDTVTGDFLTNQGTGTFTAGADVVPSPDTPIDIVCNNGVLKARHQSGLPLGYQAVEYLQSSGTQYIDTGYIANDGMAIEAKATPGGTRGSYTLWIGSIGVSTENPDDTRNAVGVNGNSLSWQKGRVYNGAGFALSNNNPVVIYMNTIGNAFEGKANGTTLNVNPSSTQQTLTGLTTTVKIGYSDYSSAARAMTIYYFKMWNNNYELIQNLIPCRRNSDSVLGMYDTVTGNFLTNAGTGTFTAGDTVSDPIAIYTDGTTETVNITGKNLFDKNGEFIKFNTAADYIGIPVPNGTYTCSTNIPQQSANDRNAWFDNQNETFSSTVNGVSSNNSRTVTTNSGMIYFAIRKSYKSSLIDGTYWVQIEAGSTATTYEPYFDGGTATAENLFKIGDYKDVQEVLTGSVTRNVGVKVFDGTENWQSIVSPYFSLAKSDITPSTLSGDNFNSICSHFVRAISGTILTEIVSFYWGKSYFNIDIDPNGATTVNQFKQYLADQYANGTPVIIVYPLATATTETVTAQPLTTQAGNNTISIVQASIDNLGLEVSYKATV